MNCENCNGLLTLDQESKRSVPYCSENCRRKIHHARKTKKEITSYFETNDKRLENYTIGSLKKHGFVVSVKEKTISEL